MDTEIKIVARYYANGQLITNEEFCGIVFSHVTIDRILQEVNRRLGVLG